MAKFLVEILINAAGEPQARAVFDSVGASARKSADDVSAASLKSETALRNLTASAAKYQSQMADTTKSKNFVADMTALNGKLAEQLAAWARGSEGVAEWTRKQKDAALAQQILTAQVKAGVSANSDAGKQIASQITQYQKLTSELNKVKQEQQQASGGSGGGLLSSLLGQLGGLTGEGEIITSLTEKIVLLAEAEGGAGAATAAMMAELLPLLPILLAVGAAAAVVGVGWKGFEFLKESISEGMKAQEVISQLNQILAQNGSASGLSARQMQEYADSLVAVSGRDDDVILKAEMILSRFNKLNSEGSFKTATKYALDYAATGKSVDEAAEVVGKALAGNAKTFFSLAAELGGPLSKTQKQSIQEMLDHGKTAEYQAIVIDLLDKKVGGLAEKYAHNLAGSIAISKTVLSEFQKGIASEVIPSLEDLVSELVGTAGGWASIRAMAQAAGHYVGDEIRKMVYGIRIYYHEWEADNYDLEAKLVEAFRMIVFGALDLQIKLVDIFGKLPGIMGAPYRQAAADLRTYQASTTDSLGKIAADARKSAQEQADAALVAVAGLASHRQALIADEEVHKGLGGAIDDVKGKIKDHASVLAEAAKEVQAYADKISDLATKYRNELITQSALLSAAKLGEEAYKREQLAQEISIASTAAETSVRQAQRSEIEKLTAARDKLREAGDPSGAAKIQDDINKSNAGLDFQIKLVSGLAVAKVQEKQATDQILAIGKDERSLLDQLALSRAALGDAINGDTAETRNLAIAQAAEKDRLALLPPAVREYLTYLRQEIDRTHELAAAQKSVTGLSQQAQLQVAISGLDTSVSAALHDLGVKYLDFVANLGHGSLDEGNRLLAGMEGGFKAVTDKIKADLLAVQDAAKLTVIRGDSKSVSTLYFQERADIESLISRSTGKVAGIEADGKRALEVIDKKFIDSQLSAYSSAFGILSSEFGGVFTKILQFVKYLQEIQTLKDDITTIIGGLTGLGSIFGLAGGATATNTGAVISLTAAVAANTVALGGQAAVSGSGGSSLSLSSIVSLVRAGYAYYTGGYSAGGVLGAGWSGGVGVGSGGGYAGGAANYGSTASSAGSGATGAAWFAAIALLALDWLKTKGTPWATSNITFGGTQGIGIGNAAGNQGGATSADAKRNIGEALSAALDVVNSVKSFIYQLGGAIDLTVKAATSTLSIQKHGQGSSTDWIVTSLTGQILHFGKDVQAAEEYAVIQAIKAAPEIGLSPEVVTAIKNSTANTVKAFQQDIDTATQAVKDRLGSEGSQVHDILDTYRKQRDAEIALGLSTDATTATMLKQISAMGNQLIGVDTSLADHLAAILSYNKGVEEAANTLTSSIQGVLGMSVQAAQDYVAKYADLLSQYHYVQGTPGDPKGNKDATPGQWVDALGKAADDTTLAILAKVGPLQQALKAYADQLGKLPEEISKNQMIGSVFMDLLKYVKDAGKYEADRAKIAKSMVDIQFGLWKAQLVIAGIWEDLAALFTDAYNQAVTDATTPVRAPHSSSGSGVSIADQQAALRAQIASMVAEAGGGVLKAYYDLSTQIATFTKSAKDAKLPATELAAAVDLMTQKFRAGLLLQAQGYAGVGTGFTQNLQGVTEFFHQLETLGRSKTGIPNWLEKLLKGDALDKLGVELQTSLDQFNGLVNPMVAINTQADTLRQNVIAYGKAMGWTADQIQAALDRIAQGVDYQKATAINGIMDTLFGYLKDNQAFTQEAADLKKQEVELQFTIIEAQLKALNAWDAETQKIFAAAKQAAQAITTAANIIYPDTSGAGGAAYYENLAKVMADAAVAWQQGISDFTRSTQAVLTNPSITGLTQHQQFQAAGDQFEALLARARAGDTTALSQLDAARTTALNLAHAEYGGGQGFLEFYQRIMGESADLLAHAQQGEQSAVQMAIANLNTSGTQNTQSLVQAIYASANQVAQAIYQSFLALPHYGDGAITNRPHMALVGEKGPEAIIPMRNVLRYPQARMMAEVGRGGGVRAGSVGRLLSGGWGQADGGQGQGSGSGQGQGQGHGASDRAILTTLDNLTRSQNRMADSLKSIAASSDTTAKTNDSMAKNERINLMVGKRNG